MALPVALQLYSVRDDLEADFRGTLEKVKEMGYAGVEFAGLYGHSAKEIKAMTDEIGLVPISAHVPLVDMVADPEGIMALYEEIGCKYIVVPYVTEERRPGADKFDTMIEEIKMLGAVAKKHGMQLLYHNHDFEFVKVNGEIGLDVLYASVPADLLATEIDTCWANVGGEDPAAYVKKYTGRAPVVHLKDFFISGKLPKHMYALIGIDEDEQDEEPSSFELRPLGRGVQNVPALLDAAVAAGAEWVVVEQDNPEAGSVPMKSVKVSREYLASLGW